jgi:integrase
MEPEVRTLKSGTKTYRIRFTYAGRQYRTNWSNDYNEILRQGTELWLSAQSSNTAGPNGQISVSNFSVIWLERHAFSRNEYSSAIKNKQHLSKHILPRIGKETLSALSASQIDQMIYDIKIKWILKPKTLNNILGTLRKMLNDAVKWRYLNINPANQVEPIKLQVQEVTYFHHGEAIKLIETAKANFKHDYEVIHLALLTGCRLGELMALNWKKVNLDTKFVLINSTYDEALKKIVQRTKGKRFRQVPLNSEALKLLQKMSLDGRRLRSDLIFPDTHYRTVKDRFKRLLKQANLNDAVDRGATFHTTRHTFATQFMKNGGNIYHLQKILGHSTIKQTEKYAHFSPNYLIGATDNISFQPPEGDLIKVEFAQNFAQRNDGTKKE